jgi:hypothetical protein
MQFSTYRRGISGYQIGSIRAAKFEDWEMVGK